MQHSGLLPGGYSMKTTKSHFYSAGTGINAIVRGFKTLRPGMLALAVALSVGIAAGSARADEKKPSPAAPGQTQGAFIEEDELNAYRAAKMEPDPHKRATKLMEFLQKYPKSPLLEAGDYEEMTGIEDEHNAYHTARQEPDYDKRSEMLIEFLQKYPASSLAGNVKYEYMKMLKESSQNKKYELLESLADRWLKSHPDDKETYALLAEATMNLKKYQKCSECLEEIYKMQPSPSLALEIHTTYQKTENLTKQIEWAEKLFKMPEFESDYMLRYGYVMKYFEGNNLSKAAEYSQLTLRSADLAGQKDTAMQPQLRKVRRACHHVIASNLMEKGNFAEAIASFKRALKAERYGQGYYRIGVCLENQKNVEEAILHYAVAETMGEEDAPKAKSRLEVLYKALHNDTLIGIDKVYKRAKELLAEAEPAA
jgi:tetratricopeptide (TPR) repeat protein